MRARVQTRPTRARGRAPFADALPRRSLPSNNLAGTLPASLGVLTSLTLLNLSTNALHGTVPPQVAALYLPCEGGNVVAGAGNTVSGCFNRVTGTGNVVDGRGNIVVGDGARRPRPAVRLFSSDTSAACEQATR